MKYLKLLLILAVATAFTSCKTDKTKTASNPYEKNPYYGPTSKTKSGSSSTYSSSAPSSKYPSYSDSTYTPPTSSSSAPVPTYSASAYTPSSSGSSSASGGSHTVMKGENLFRISLKHNTSIAAIRSANGLSGDTIHPGQVLTIPN